MSQRRVDPTLITQAPNSLEALLQLLVEGLGWPLPDHLHTLPTLEWSPEELHLDPANLGRLTSIQQVPKLQADQPFGVFVLTFSGGRLPIGALRKLVSQLVTKQRSRHRGHPQWDLGDLVFFCHNDDGPGSVHVVALREEEGKQRIKTISWTGDPTPTRLQLLSHHALLDLSWPGSNDIAINEWRDQWRSAFTVGYREGVKSAEALSQRMAEVAAEVRDELSNLLEVETADGPLHALLNDFRERLVATIDEAAFADMFAQTLVYGLLSARVSNPEKFEASESRALLDFENPLLETLYERFNDTADDSLDLDHLGLADLAHTLAATDVDAILAGFGSKDRRDDPVIYLYEEFLDKYDPDQRRALGAYYTPIPVVTATVRMVDEILRDDLGFPDGIADTRSWSEWAANDPERQLPAEMDTSSPVISMIDPATGTGTYLLEWIRVLKARKPEALPAALDSIGAIELSLASYAVAHLKTGLELPREVRASHRLPIYLGDTLAGPAPDHITQLSDPIAAETAAADDAKFTRRANIIIGNPPYQRIERDAGGGWVLHPEQGQPDLFADILDPAVEHTIFSYTANLYNLYVYYWRWAIWKAFEQHGPGPGVVAFITASSWLTGPGFLGLRRLTRQHADDIWVIDLGGDNKGARTDENIFGIETPVAIVILARQDSSREAEPGEVKYTRISGDRGAKLAQLESLMRTEVKWEEGPRGWFEPLKPPTGAASWTALPKLTDLFPWQQPGCMYNRTWPIAPHPELLLKRWDLLLGTSNLVERAALFKTAKTGRNIHTKVSGLPRLAEEPVGAPARTVTGYELRSFDRQWTLDDPRLAKTDSPSLWTTRGPNQVYLLSSPTGALSTGPALTVTTEVPDKHVFNGRGGKDVFPLFRDTTGTPNVDPALLRYINEALGADDSGSLAPEDLMAYCYGLLAGADYTTRFNVELETPGPRVPITRDPSLFQQVTAHGAYLLWLHTGGTRFGQGHPSSMPRDPNIRWDPEPTGIPIDPAAIEYNASTRTLALGGGTLHGVRPDVMAFEVSGMQALGKWLGYRTRKGAGRASSSDNPLDQIRPERWYPEWTHELEDLVNTLTATLDAYPIGIELLDRVLAGEQITADELPKPPDHLRRPPEADRGNNAPTLM